MPEVLSLSLEEVSVKLGVSPSAVKKRVANLNIPVMRGPRGKLIFDQHAFALLAEADGLLKAGLGFEECRKRLKLEQPAAIDVEAVEAVEAVVPAEPHPAEGNGRPRKLQAPVFVRLRQRKPEPKLDGPLPDLLARLDATLKLLEDKDRHNQMLQAKLLVAHEEIAKLTASTAAYQERTAFLQLEVQRLHSEIKLLAEPEESRPWWNFWT